LALPETTASPSPAGAAGLSFATFASGAAVPILPFLFVSGTQAIAAAAVPYGLGWIFGTVVG
jgi:VIT1/CCC1 family predicted Fe2+/Mn2+ transporter